MGKSKIKLAETYFNKEDGLSQVTLSTPFGHFTGSAICNYADGDEFSELVGGSFAEMRAWIKYYKTLALITRQSLKELNGIYCCSKPNKTRDMIKQRMDELQEIWEVCNREISLINKEIDARNEYLGKKDK